MIHEKRNLLLANSKNPVKATSILIGIEMLFSEAVPPGGGCKRVGRVGMMEISEPCPVSCAVMADEWVRVPVREPLADGVNVMVIVQLAFPGSGLGQLLV